MRAFVLTGHGGPEQLVFEGACPVPKVHAGEVLGLDREHREILAACEARDPERAARAMRCHLAQTVAHVTDDLAKHPAS